MIEWGWPFSGSINVHHETFVKVLDEWLNQTFPHYNPQVIEQSPGEEWYVDVSELSTPETSKVWKWIESWGLTNSEA